MEYIQQKIAENPLVDLEKKIACWSIARDEIGDEINSVEDIIGRLAKCHLIKMSKTEEHVRLLFYEGTNSRAIVAGNLAISENKIKVVEKSPQENAKVATFVKKVKNGTLLEAGTHLYLVSSI